MFVFFMLIFMFLKRSDLFLFSGGWVAIECNLKIASNHSTMDGYMESLLVYRFLTNSSCYGKDFQAGINVCKYILDQYWRACQVVITGKFEHKIENSFKYKLFFPDFKGAEFFKNPAYLVDLVTPCPTGLFVESE